MGSNLKYYKDAITETLWDIDRTRYSVGLIRRDDLNRLLVLTEAYAVACKAGGYNLDESEMFIRVTERLVKEYKYRGSTLNEGFENPFDTDDNTDISIWYDDVCDVDDPEENISIRRVRLWNDNTDGKVNYRDGKIVAGQFFAKNDTIENCPVRIIHPSDLYSKNVRDFAFDIDPKKNLCGIPFGYASYYRNSLDCNLEPNADYEYVDGPNRIIRIYATRPIKRGNEIVLVADREMYDNEFNDSDFRYDREPFYSIKNVTMA